MRWSLLIFLLFSASLIAQKHNVNGVHEKYEPYICIKNASIHVSGDKTIENGMLLIKGNRIEKVGKLFLIPSGAIVLDYEGQHIYPSFVEMNSNYGMPEAKSEHEKRQPQLNSTKQGAYHWNESIQPEKSAAELWKASEKDKKSLLKKGVGTVVTHQKDGIVRGTSTALFLSDRESNVNLISDQAAQHFSFKKGVSKQSYPSSQMGAIALIRQLYYDTEWYAQFENPDEKNLSYEAFLNQQGIPQIFEASDKFEVLRAAKIAKEFNLKFIIKGGGDEYQLMDEMKASGASFILPIDYQKAYDLKDPYHTEMIPLSKLKHWELAPSNPYFFYRSGIPFCLSIDGIEKSDEVFKNIRKTVEYGLPEGEMLDALTLYPAQFLGLDEHIGTLEPGKKANFIITNFKLSHKNVEILENWCLGEQTVVKESNQNSLSGAYDLNVNKHIYDLHIKEKEPGKISAQIYIVKKDSVKDKVDTTKVKVAVEQDERNEL